MQWGGTRFNVQSLIVASDTFDPARRIDELCDTIRGRLEDIINQQRYELII